MTSKTTLCSTNPQESVLSSIWSSDSRCSRNLTYQRHSVRFPCQARLRLRKNLTNFYSDYSDELSNKLAHNSLSRVPHQSFDLQYIELFSAGTTTILPSMRKTFLEEDAEAKMWASRRCSLVCFLFLSWTNPRV